MLQSTLAITSSDSVCQNAADTRQPRSIPYQLSWTPVARGEPSLKRVCVAMKQVPTSTSRRPGQRTTGRPGKAASWPPSSPGRVSKTMGFIGFLHPSHYAGTEHTRITKWVGRQALQPHIAELPAHAVTEIITLASSCAFPPGCGIMACGFMAWYCVYAFIAGSEVQV